ncbi:B3 domain-containing protein Os03g0619800-like [Miscanthus floridulus]|uniref:B3 domain-containing protein Os03g0619800-like n=1 Tax=Miscanthus floridulus TaxID=154761 RepID=UPI00345A7E02
MNIVCEVCGDIGYRQLLLCCRDCKRYAVHQYCLDKVVFDASLIEWFCYECLQRRGEVTCVRSLEQVSSERPLNHAQFGSPVHHLTTKRVESVRDAGPYSSNGGCEELFSCPGIETIPSVRERSVDPINISSISQHDSTEASASSERSTECQKASSCRRGKTVKMSMESSSSSEESGEDILSENVSLEYVLAYRCYLSKAQKKRVMELIQEIQPEFTVFISIMRKGNVQPPGPFLGITRDYASAHFPDESTNVTLEAPGKSKKWHPKFYKRAESRNYMLIGQWLDFVRENHVQEGDICLLVPTKDEIRCTFMVYVLHETTYSRGGAGFQMAGPCPGASSAKMASEIHIEEEPTAGEHVSSASDMQEIPHEPVEGGDSDDPFVPPYIVPCKSPLSKSQKRTIEERVRAIRSEIPICVAVMKNNNVGVAQRWMLELGSRYGSVYLPTKGQTIWLQCGGKTWKAKMMFHNGRRWFLNGGWPNFARGNGLRVGDVCLFELKKESKLTMAVHIIRREKF